MRIMYHTKDGRQFTSPELADKWEDTLFNAWLNRGPTIKVDSLLAIADKLDRLGGGGHTEHGILRVLKRWWETNVETIKS